MEVCRASLGAQLLLLCGTQVFSLEVGSCWGGKRASDRAALPYGAALGLQLSLLLSDAPLLPGLQAGMPTKLAENPRVTAGWAECPCKKRSHWEKHNGVAAKPPPSMQVEAPVAADPGSACGEGKALPSCCTSLPAPTRQGNPNACCRPCLAPRFAALPHPGAWPGLCSGCRCHPDYGRHPSHRCDPGSIEGTRCFRLSGEGIPPSFPWF